MIIYVLIITVYLDGRLTMMTNVDDMLHQHTKVYLSERECEEQKERVLEVARANLVLNIGNCFKVKVPTGA